MADPAIYRPFLAMPAALTRPPQSMPLFPPVYFTLIRGESLTLLQFVAVQLPRIWRKEGRRAETNNGK